MSKRITTLPVLIAVTLAAFGLVLGFAIGGGELLALAERPDGSTPLDSSITSWVVEHRTAALTAVARVCSTLGSQAVLLPVVGIVAGVLLIRRRLAPAGLLIVAWAGATGLYSLAKLVVHRERPPRGIWLTHVRGTSSFPSGHATQSLSTFVALAVVGWAWLPPARWPLRIAAVVLAAGVGWSRVYLGVHWSTDVIAGWLISAAWIAIVACLARAAMRIDGRDPGSPSDRESAAEL